MDNFTNTSLNYTSPLSGPGFVIFNVVMLLGVELPVIAVNVAILVALVLEASTVKAIRLVLASILVSCILTALGLAMYHISGIILNISPVSDPPKLPCTITVFLVAFGGAARLVFMATFAVIVYIIVKYGKATKKHFTVSVLVAVVALWLLSFLGISPLLSQAVVHTGYLESLSCGPQPNSIYSYAFVGWYVVFFGMITLTVTVVFLIVTVCFIKHRTIPDDKVKTSMVKFGFFLLLGNGINLVGQIAPSLSATIIVPAQDVGQDVQHTAFAEVIYAAYTLMNAALIPTPILLLIYFEPIRKRLWSWLCCYVPKKRKNGRIRKSSGVGSTQMTSSGV